MIYLDSAATSLLKPPSVARAASMAIRTMASPGRGGHSAAMRAADTVFACRAAAAALFHVPICIAADLVCFFLGLNKQFLFLSFGGTVGFVDNLFCLIFRTSDFRFRYAFAVGNA